MKGFKNFGRSIMKRVLTMLLVGTLLMPYFNLLLPATTVYALKQAQAITYEYYTVNLGNVVPASWMFVGTYLMSVKGVTPRVYKKALESRDIYEQPIAYYTSELDRGVWKSIEKADSIGTILPGSETVEDKELMPYLITAVVGDDGIPVDPVSGKPIDIFDINSPYEMENIPELKPILDFYQKNNLGNSKRKSEQYFYTILNEFFENDNQEDFDRKALDVVKAKKQYESLLGDGKKENQEKIESIWNDAMRYNPVMFPTNNKEIMTVMQNWPNIRDNLTDRTDADMKALNTLFNKLEEKKLSEEADAALVVEEEIDCERRSEVFYNLLYNNNLTGSYKGDDDSIVFGMAPTLTFLLDAVQKGSPEYGRKFQYMYGKSPLRIPVLERLLSESFEENDELVDAVKLSIKQCTEAYEYNQKKTMMRGSTAYDYVGYLLSRNIVENAANYEKALPFLQMFVDLQNIDSGNIVHEKREESLLNEYLIPIAASKFEKNKTIDYTEDYQYYIRALTTRQDLNDAISFVEDRISYAKSLKSHFNKADKTELLNSHIVWLENLLRALKNKAGLDGNDIFDTQVAELKKDRDEALDEGDLKRARKIGELLKELGSSEDGDTTGEGDGLDNGGSGLSPTDIDPSKRPMAEAIIGKIILDDIKKTGYDPSSDIDAYKSIGGDLDGLSGKLGSNLNPEYFADNSDSDTGGDDGADNTAGRSLDITTDDIENALNDVLGDKDKRSAKAKATAAAALVDLSNINPSDDLEKYLKDLLDELMREGNTFIYRQYTKDSSLEYVSLGAVDNSRFATGFRYVEENSVSQTTMSQIFGGSASYTFILHSKELFKSNGDKDELTINAVEQTDKYIKTKDNRKYTYIFEDDAKKYLNVSCRYVRGTDYAILVTEGMDPKIKRIVEILEALEGSNE